MMLPLAKLKKAKKEEISKLVFKELLTSPAMLWADSKQLYLWELVWVA